MTSKVWSFGDRVVHTGKPEWGAGVVSTATKTTHEGRPCQSLTIRFDRAGVKTISTAFATLVPAEQAGGLLAEAAASNGAAEDLRDDPLKAKIWGVEDFRARMSKLPEPATDPFTTAMDRLKATLGLYRFAPTGGSLLDWAAMQSGLSDPMSRFNRHELEQFFEAFMVARDNHLRKVIQDARKADPTGAARMVSQAPASAQQALRRIDAKR